MNVVLAVQGHPEAALSTIQSELVPTIVANYAVWPLAHIINFRFVPSQQRILYINFIQVWLSTDSDPSAKWCTLQVEISWFDWSLGMVEDPLVWLCGFLGAIQDKLVCISLLIFGYCLHCMSGPHTGFV